MTIALTQPAADWLEGRGIWADTAVRFGVYTANITNMRGATVLAFPFVESGVVVNEKFRQLPKEKFWQHKGRRKIFWNADALDDPGLESGYMPLIITEGELDALTAIQCGFPLTVSVPDGAPPAGALSGRADKTDEQAEQTGKFEFLWEARDKLKRVKRFIIAVDDDGPGRCLAEHLVRRLSAGRCSFVSYPMGCKDLNDVLINHGAEAVAAVLNGAKQYPVRGLYRLSDYPQQEALQTFDTGWELLDDHLRLFAGEFMVVTGIPSHGKSSWVLNLIANMAQIHGLRSAVFSPEMSVVPMIRDRLRCLKSGRAIERAVSPENDAWIEDNFTFIGPDPLKKIEDDDFDLQWVIDRAEDAVLRDGIRILVIDPWNEIEHAIGRGQTMTEYIGTSIRALRRFAKLYNLIVIVVAHPTKLTKQKDGTYEPPSLYDISDSAHWFNKADHGITVHRNSQDITTVSVVKSRFEETGTRGSVNMRYDKQLRRFYRLDRQAQGA